MILFRDFFLYVYCDYCAEILTPQDGLILDKTNYNSLHYKCLELMQNPENIKNKIEELKQTNAFKNRNYPKYREVANRINWLKFQLNPNAEKYLTKDGKEFKKMYMKVRKTYYTKQLRKFLWESERIVNDKL